jgi:Na+-transporting NADH:ubiquinone oxidoreductase subunit NqrB
LWREPPDRVGNASGSRARYAGDVAALTCTDCDYDLTGTPLRSNGRVCPECGVAVLGHARERPSRWPLLVSCVVIAALAPVYVLVGIAWFIFSMSWSDPIPLFVSLTAGGTHSLIALHAWMTRTNRHAEPKRHRRDRIVGITAAVLLFVPTCAIAACAAEGGRWMLIAVAKSIFPKC